MPEVVQSDSLIHAAADSIMSFSRQDLNAYSHQSKAKVKFFSKKDFEKSAYMLHYDSLHFSYTLDSTAVKSYQLSASSTSLGSFKGYSGNQIPSMLKHHDSIFLSLLLCFVLICKIIQRGYRFFFEGFRLLTTFREKKDLFNEITIKEFWGNLFLILLPSFLVSLLAYQYLQNSDDVLRQSSHIWLTLTGFILIIAGFLSLKYLFYLLIGYTFDIRDFVHQYLRAYLILLELLGILIFVPTLVYLYAGAYQQVVLIIVAILFLIIRLILFSRLIAFFFNKKVNFLFGIIYLCSVEIIPYIFIIMGFAYLYKENIFCIL